MLPLLRVVVVFNQSSLIITYVHCLSRLSDTLRYQGQQHHKLYSRHGHRCSRAKFSKYCKELKKLRTKHATRTFVLDCKCFVFTLVFSCQVSQCALCCPFQSRYSVFITYSWHNTPRLGHAHIITVIISTLRITWLVWIFFTKVTRSKLFDVYFSFLSFKYIPPHKVSH